MVLGGVRASRVRQVDANLLQIRAKNLFTNLGALGRPRSVLKLAGCSSIQRLAKFDSQIMQVRLQSVREGGL